MITLFGKPEPTLLVRLKESVGKTKDALADTLDTITQGGRQIDPSVLKEVENALLWASKPRAKFSIPCASRCLATP